MKIVIYGATEIGCLLATEFFEDHDITVIDKEENRTEDFDRLDISFIQGSAADINVLNQFKYPSVARRKIFIIGFSQLTNGNHVNKHLTKMSNKKT